MIKKVLKLLVTNYIDAALYYTQISYMLVNYEKPEDFISDESFVSWFFKTNEESVKQWDLWLQTNPEKKPLVDEASRLLTLFGTKENPVSDEQLSSAEKQLRMAMGATAKVIHIIAGMATIILKQAAQSLMH